MKRKTIKEYDTKRQKITNGIAFKVLKNKIGWKARSCERRKS